MEDYAYILDYLPTGRQDVHKFRREPVAYAVGESEFKLFELTPKEGVTLTISEKVYIGKDMERREKILHVKRRVGYNDLTHNAQKELRYVIEDIVKNNEKRFVEFYNTAPPITTRLHSLALLPGLGKKTMWQILEEREKKPFESFDDIKERVPSLKHPEKPIVERILTELMDPNQKYRLFVAK